MACRNVSPKAIAVRDMAQNLSGEMVAGGFFNSKWKKITGP
jgi:hypothetical protein